MSPTPRLRLPPHPALAGHTAYLAFRLAGMLRSTVDAELEELNMTWAEFKALVLIAAVDGLCQEALHDRIDVDRGSLSRLLRDLEYEGFIGRRPKPTDGRKVLCLPMAAGAEAAAEASAAVERATGAALRALHAKERERLRVLMARAIGAG